MATVYIFDNDKRTGHAALELDNGEYISFHPRDPAKSLIGIATHSYKPFFSPDIDTDLDEHHERVTNEVRIRGLHEEEMSNAFEDMKHSTNYQFFSMNCSTVVANLLIVGAGEAIVGGPLRQAMTRFEDHVGTLFVPNRNHRHGRLTENAIDLLHTASKAMLHSAQKGHASRGILPYVLAAYVVSDVVVSDYVWKPGDVLHLAEHIKAHLQA